MANKLSDLVIDEVSLVRKGANQHAKVTIAKSYDGGQEGQDMLFDEDGNPVDIDQLEEGQVVYDEEGSGFVLEVEGEDDFDVNWSRWASPTTRRSTSARSSPRR